MPELKIECPYCGETTGTGKAVESEGFLRAIRIKGVRTDCENCGKTITWSKRDVVNEDDIA